MRCLHLPQPNTTPITESPPSQTRRMTPQRICIVQCDNRQNSSSLFSGPNIKLARPNASALKQPGLPHTQHNYSDDLAPPPFKLSFSVNRGLTPSPNPDRDPDSGGETPAPVPAPLAAAADATDEEKETMVGFLGGLSKGRGWATEIVSSRLWW